MISVERGSTVERQQNQRFTDVLANKSYLLLCRPSADCSKSADDQGRFYSVDQKAGEKRVRLQLIHWVKKISVQVRHMRITIVWTRVQMRCCTKNWGCPRALMNYVMRTAEACFGLYSCCTVRWICSMHFMHGADVFGAAQTMHLHKWDRQIWTRT